MRKKSVFIQKMAYASADHKIPNSFFDELDIGSSAEWIKERTGILSRYSVLSPEMIWDLRKGKTTNHQLQKDPLVSSLATLAEKTWEAGLREFSSENKVSPELLLCGTSVPDFDIPASSSMIAKKLRLKSTCFDVNSACSSFISNLMVASSLLAGEIFHSALIVNAERYTLRLNFQERGNCILFGDGAATSLLSTEAKSGFEILDLLLHSDSTGAETVKIPINDLFFQDGSKVQKFAISKTCEASKELMQRNKVHASDLQYFIGHQANLRMLSKACEHLGFCEEQHLYNVDFYGNQGGASAPSVLAQNWHKFKTGDLVLVSVVGSGLTWGSALLRFHK